jgi:hypothetical protein
MIGVVTLTGPDIEGDEVVENNRGHPFPDRWQG